MEQTGTTLLQAPLLGMLLDRDHCELHLELHAPQCVVPLSKVRTKLYSLLNGTTNCPTRKEPRIRNQRQMHALKLPQSITLPKDNTCLNERDSARKKECSCVLRLAMAVCFSISVRFASGHLRTHLIHSHEGRTRLLAASEQSIQV